MRYLALMATIALGLAFLVAAGSVGYHYAVYIPTRDAQLDNERRFEKARILNTVSPAPKTGSVVAFTFTPR